MDGQISSQQQLVQTTTSTATTSQVDGQISSQQHPFQNSSVNENILYKNRLQHLVQKAGLPLPVYRTVQEHDMQQILKFRCSVEVDGEKYTSLNTFLTRKAAEQDAAKLALESIPEKIKNYTSKKKSSPKKTTNVVFPPIHQDRFFCKSILHEFAMKKNLEKPTYDTVNFESVIPMFVSSLVFDGVKYTGEPSVHKKEAEQLAARAVILSTLANSGVETVLSEIVKSKAKLINAVNGHCNASTTVSHLPNSGTDVVQELVSDNIQEMGDMIGSVTSEEPQQHSASKKRRFPDLATASCSVNENVPIPHQLQSHAPLRQEFGAPNLETLPQPSLLPSIQTPPQPPLIPNARTPSQSNLPTSCQSPYQSSLIPSFQNFPQPSLLPDAQTLSQPSSLPSTQTLPQPSLLPNYHVLSQPTMSASSPTPSQSSLLPSFQNIPQTTLLPNAQSLTQPSELPSTQTLLQPSLLPNCHVLSQPSAFPSIQTLPQPNLLPNAHVLPQSSAFPSAQTLPQPSLLPNSHVISQPSLPSSSQAPPESSLLTGCQTLPQPICLPVTSAPSLDPQCASSKAAAKRRRKKINKANKIANSGNQMQASAVSPSPVPSCTIAQ